MVKKLFAVLLAFFVLFSMFPAYSVYAIDTEKEVTVSYLDPETEMMEAASKVELYRGGELYLSANVQNGVSGDMQWQIKADRDLWVDIQGETEKELRVSYGMVQDLLKNDSVRVRCAVSGKEEYCSDAIKIVVTDENKQAEAAAYSLEEETVAPNPLAAPVGIAIEPEASEEPAEETSDDANVPAVMALKAAAPVSEDAVLDEETPQDEPMLQADANQTDEGVTDEDVTYRTVTIEYVYSAKSKFSGQRVALPYIAEVVSGTTLLETVASPNCVGYVPNISEVKLADYGKITANISIKVEYSPALVSYTVRHYQQNVDDDEYVWVDTTMATGYTEDLTSDNAAKKYTGFAALSHYHEEIAADSSTVIDIYYDRNYYLMSFELDGGSGVKPIYARYGTEISVGTPSKPGWVFNGWKDEGDNSVTIPKKIPEGDRTFSATWNPDPKGTKYSVAYWIDNGNGTKTYLATKEVSAKAGDVVSGKDDICGTEAHTHSDACRKGCVEHIHGLSCFSEASIVKIGDEVTNENDLNAIDDANVATDSDSVYFYFIQSEQDVQNGKFWPKLYVDGTYYTITVEGGNSDGSINQTVFDSIKGDFLRTGEYTPRLWWGGYGDTYYARKYKVKTVASSGTPIITCEKTEHVHDNSCTVCKIPEHSHSATCEPAEAQKLEFMEANENVTVSGDGTTVVNVYYTYRTYTIRFVYARQSINGGNYDIATLTRNGALNNCNWQSCGNSLPGFTKDPSGKTEPSYFTSGTYRYYYISLTAKYGSDISDLWPAANIQDIANYKWGSWAAAPDTGYREKYGDEHANIVGIYPTMSEDMIGKEPELLEIQADGTKVYLAQNMVAWWANTNSNPKPNVEKHAYHNYFEVTNGSTDGAIKYGDKYYRLQETITFTAAHNGDTRVDPIKYGGYTCVNDTNGTLNDLQGNSQNFDNNGNCSICGTECNYCNTFYYDAVRYKLQFWNHNKWLPPETGEAVSYGTTLAAYQSNATALAKANYPEGLEEGVYEFDGWYTTKECYEDTKVNWSTLTMPASNLVLYAKWKPIIYEVKIYTTEGGSQIGSETVTVTHGEPIPPSARPNESQLKHPTDEKAELIGWFYRDENGIEQAFDFANMVVGQDMNIYAKWRSNAMKQVVIDYVVVNTDGTITKVADTETLTMRLGQTRTFDAKTGNTLYPLCREQYFPLTASHSITIDDDHIASPDPVRYTFEYKKYGKVPYQVEFYVKEADGTERPAFQKTSEGEAQFVEAGDWNNSCVAYTEDHWDNQKAIVTELYIPENLAEATWNLPPEYVPNALRAQKVIVPSQENPETNISANTIKFIYTYSKPIEDPENPGTPMYPARYLVQHFVQDPSNLTSYNMHSYTDEDGLSTQSASASPISIPGYTYNYSVTNEKKQSGTSLNESTGEMTGIIDADDGLQLNFYYTVNKYPYKVMYLEDGSNRVLAPEKTTGVGGNKLTGYYGAEVTEGAVDIEGYEVVGASSKSIFIQMEAGDTANVNTIVFYYREKNGDLVISKDVKLDEEQAAEEGIADIPDWVYEQKFEFTIYQPHGFAKSLYECTITHADNTTEDKTISADLQTIVITLKPGEKIQIHGLSMGEYKVTETYVPGFNASAGGTPGETHSVTLDYNGEVESLDFVNAFPFYTGDLILKKNVEKLDSGDPDATEPYKVSVVLKPDDAAREIDRKITFVDENGNSIKDVNNNTSFTIPKLTGSDDESQFTIEVMVPVDGQVILKDVPVGTFAATEEVKGTVGYIYDYYLVKYNKELDKVDAATGTNHTVQDTIYGGHSASVAFRNKYKKGTLTINKSVMQEYEKDSWQKDTFTFEITGTTELPDGTYPVDNAKVIVDEGTVTVKDKHGNDPVISISKADGKTEWSGSLTFEKLPAGYYTVTETATLGNDKYNATVPEENILVNDTNNATQFNFVNKFKRTKGDLQVGKEIVIVTEGSIIDIEQEFTFVVTPKDGTLSGPYNCTVKSTNGTMNTSDDTVVTGSVNALAVNDGKLTFQLKHNEYILIDDLPVGDYTVSEKAIEGYQSSFGDVSTHAGIYTVDPAVITTDKTTVLNCQNSYPVYYANLYVQKTVETPSDNSAIDQAPSDDVFEFTVSMSNYSDKISLQNVAAKFYDNVSDTTPEERTLSVGADDTITFNLQANQWVDLNVPACTYTITETGLNSTVNSDDLSKHYTTTYKSGDVENITESVTHTGTGVTCEGTVQSGRKEKVEFINTYKHHYLDLTIITDCDFKDQSFIFDVTAQDTAKSDISTTVVLYGKDTQVIKDLPVGDYTVTEQTKWSWRESDVTSQTVQLRDESKTVEFDFGQVDRVYWLSDYHYAKKGDR